MVTISEAVSAEDIDTARALLREYAAYLNESVGSEHICLESYEKEMASLPAPYQEPTGVILLAEADGEPAGVVALKPLAPVRSAAMQAAYPDERAGELKRLWVRPGFRGQRIGELLLQRVLDEARKRGYTALYLDTAPSLMPAAVRIYTALGFTEVEPYQAKNNILKQPEKVTRPAPERAFFRCSL
jgi:GNAT superfamily N-acetyltransferase